MAQNLNQAQINAEISIIRNNDEEIGLNHSSGFELQDLFKYVSKMQSVPVIFNDFTSYKIKNDATVEPLKTLKRLDEKTNGIYFGFGKTSGLRAETMLYMAPITVNTIFDTVDNHKYTQTFHFYKENNQTIAFRCLDTKQGTWELTNLELLKPLIDNHIKSFKGKTSNRRFGFYVGKTAFGNTFLPNNPATYVYIGKGLQLDPTMPSAELLLQLFFTKKPHFQQETTVQDTLSKKLKKKPSQNQNIEMACTVGIIDTEIKIIPQNGTSPNQPHNHQTIRPCPTLCPQ